MKKFLRVLLVLLLVAVAAIGGIFAYFRFSRSPKAIAARTLKNLDGVESASLKMTVDAGVRAEVGLLQFLGIDNTETTVTMDYDIDLFREPSMMQCNVSINAFDIEALKDIEIIVANEDGKTVRYYHFNDKWYRLPADMDDAEGTADASAGSETGSGLAGGSESDPGLADGSETGSGLADGSDSGSGLAGGSEAGSSVRKEAAGILTDTIAAKYAAVPRAGLAFVEVDPSVVAKAVLEGADVRGAAEGAFAETAVTKEVSGGADARGAAEGAFVQMSSGTQEQNDEAQIVDFRTLLQGYESGEIKMEMREETETVNEKECYVYDVDLTGDMFEKVIRFSGGGKGLIPELKTSEHVTGQLYIDAKECLPVSLTLETGDILSEKLNFEQINAVLSVTGIKLDVDVVGYNIGKTGSIPTEYTDLSDMKGMGVEEWINLALDLTGLGDVLEANE